MRGRREIKRKIRGKWVLLFYFGTALTPFWNGCYSILKRTLLHFGQTLLHFGQTLIHLGQPLLIFGMTITPFWDVLTPFWGRSYSILGRSYSILGRSYSILGWPLIHFRAFFFSFCFFAQNYYARNSGPVKI